MKQFTVLVLLGVYSLCGYSQQEFQPLFIGLQPMITQEKWYDKNEFDVNILPVVLQRTVSLRLDARITTVANYHFGNSSEFSDLGLNFTVPVFFKKKSGVSFDTKMSLYESFLKEAVETLQIVKDELKNDPVRILNIV